MFTWSLRSRMTWKILCRSSMSAAHCNTYRMGCWKRTSGKSMLEEKKDNPFQIFRYFFEENSRKTKINLTPFNPPMPHLLLTYIIVGFLSNYDVLFHCKVNCERLIPLSVGLSQGYPKATLILYPQIWNNAYENYEIAKGTIINQSWRQKLKHDCNTSTVPINIWY